jgi:hypothetical protein
LTGTVLHEQSVKEVALEVAYSLTIMRRETSRKSAMPSAPTAPSMAPSLPSIISDNDDVYVENAFRTAPNNDTRNDRNNSRSINNGRATAPVDINSGPLPSQKIPPSSINADGKSKYDLTPLNGKDAKNNRNSRYYVDPWEASMDGSDDDDDEEISSAEMK